MFLHLHSLLDLQSSPTVLPFSLSHHVETMSSPTKHTRATPLLPITRFGICFGGDVGDRTRVHSAFTTKELQQFFTTAILLQNPNKDNQHKNYAYNKTIILFHIVSWSDPPCILIKMQNQINYNLLQLCRQSWDYL